MTGASGCIGQYVAETLIQQTDHELFFLVRNPDKLGFDYEARSGITICQADLRQIGQFADLLKTVDVAILAATAWGGTQEVFDINVVKTLQLLDLLNAEHCEQVIYFSTASILNQQNQLLKEAGQLGTDYIRSKYDCLQQLSKLAIAPKITTVFPTLVLGGDEHKPYSHISSGIKDVVKWINLIRWFKADGSFHFMHTQDIAQVISYLVEHPPSQALKTTSGEILSRNRLVLGNPRLTVNQAVAEVCACLGKKIYLRVPLSMGLANLFIALFRIQMAPWDRFCLNYRHFSYQNPVHPQTLGLAPYCPSLSDVLKISGVF